MGLTVVKCETAAIFIRNENHPVAATGERWEKLNDNRMTINRLFYETEIPSLYKLRLDVSLSEEVLCSPGLLQTVIMINAWESTKQTAL